MSSKFKILVIEDEANIRNFVKTILETNGYQVFDARNGSSGKLMFLSQCPDLVVLDLGLPDIDGVDFIKMVREMSDTPIIVLSARTGENDKIDALDLGANDYVTKPFGTGELLARVRATLRDNRKKNIGETIWRTAFKSKDMTIDYDRRRILKGEEEIKLTQTEYNIVELLSLHAGRVLTYSEIIKKVWGYSDTGSVKKLQVNMANIRKKFGERPGETNYIYNELGVGYRMIEADEK